MPKIHALLIGINIYHPESRVTSLAGCINDMQAMKAFIEKNYADADPQIEELTNEQATRENIIKTFRAHLVKKAKKGDTVLLYYAGHGSFSTTAPPFKKFDGLDQDETFVCYDSRLKGNHDLTDKEIAVLLSEFKKGVHTVIIADSCHSASVTRNVNFVREPIEDVAANFNLAGKRFTKSRKGSRNLKSYLLSDHNYYTKLGNNVSIPRSKHLLMSACNRNEEAWETTERRGLFTTTLLEILNEEINISYQELFARVRTLVYNVAKNQQPTLYPSEGFNANCLFLKPEEKPNRKRHQIQQDAEGGEWRMELGAINGLPTKANEIGEILVGIYKGIGKKSKFIETAKVERVQITELSIKDPKKLKSGSTYWGEIISLPTAMLVNLKGRASTLKAFKELEKKEDSAYLQFVSKFDAAKYQLKVTRKELVVTLSKTREKLFSIKGLTKTSIAELKKLLEHIAHWENIAKLENKESAISNSLDVKFLEEITPSTFEEHLGEDISMDYYKKGADKTRSGKLKPKWYQIQVKNTSNQNLYVTLLYLSSKFSVTPYYSSAIIPANSDWETLDDKHGILIDNEEDVQVTDIFKIIVSTQHFDDYKYSLEELPPPTRSSVNREDFEEPIGDDWYTHTLTVNTVRPQGKIGSRTLNLNGIKFKKHSTFKAEIAFTSLQNNASRSLNNHPGNHLSQLFGEKETEIINLAAKGARSMGQDQSIIELNDIQNLAALKSDPLVMNISADLGIDGNVIPVTTKDGFIIPLGHSAQLKDGSTEIQINQIPEGTDPTPGSQQKRSLGRAIWFSLLKLSGLKDDAFLLRKVVYEAEGAKRVPLHQHNIDKAKKVLLVIHGIIGDTKVMIQKLDFLQTEKHYDLIITFDYENLNTKIEDIAIELDKKLKPYGLLNNSNIKLDILAHSMGGLVSRYFIEYIRKGDKTVDRLFMFGTPNGGSIFGELPAYRDKLVKLLTVSLNFGKAWMGWVGTVLGVVNKALIGSKAITKTLAQMSAHSAFIEKLKESKKGHAQYTVIAGDITNYQNIKEARLARFFEAILIKVGETANSKKPNDIAVLVEDIRKLPKQIKALKYDVCCHHLNYFESDEGIHILREVVK